MKLRLSQNQKQVLAPTMQQSIAVLLLPLLELNQAIEQELQVNPLLEVDEEQLASQTQVESDYRKKLEFSKNNEVPYSNNFDEDEEPFERPVTREISLEDCLLRQLRLEISDPLRLKIGETIIGNLDEDGYLKIDFEDIANICMCNIQVVEEVLKIIQNFDPLGVASRNLMECLNIQITAHWNGESELACQIVNHYLNELGIKNYLKIAKKLSVSVETVKKIADFIATLEPKPARSFRPLANNTFVKPDITLRKDSEGEFEIIINKNNVTPADNGDAAQKTVNVEALYIMVT